MNRLVKMGCFSVIIFFLSSFIIPTAQSGTSIPQKSKKTPCPEYESQKIKKISKSSKRYSRRKKPRAGQDALPPSGYLKTRFNNSVGHARQDIIEREIIPPGPSGIPGPLEPIANCGIEGIRGLTGNELLNYLKANDYNCLGFLWSYNDEVREVFSAENMITVFREIERLAPNYDGANQQGLYSLIGFTRIGYTHDYYNDDLEFGQSVLEAMYSAFDALSVNPSFADFKYDAILIATEFIRTIDAAGAGGHFLGAYKAILRAFLNDDFSHRRVDYNQCECVKAVLDSLQRTGSHDYTEVDQELIDLLEELALNRDFEIRYEYVVREAIEALGTLTVDANEVMDASIVQALTRTLDTHPYLSRPYIFAAAFLEKVNRCHTARPGECVHISDANAVVPEFEPCQLQRPGECARLTEINTDELNAMLFPNTFSFDNGAIVVKTPLDLKKVQYLYHALKEVEAQFNRITETIIPLADDRNGTLTMVLYGNKADYETYNRFVYHLAVDNGGLYREQEGTLYTFERLPSESQYTLEELLRHEFAHYLIGRFLMPGCWGDPPRYTNNRMAWFDEGMAEFLTWSGQLKVEVRKRLVENISRDTTRMHLSEILFSTYSAMPYSYAGLFFNYLYEKQIGILKELIRYAPLYDTGPFNNLVEQMAEDIGLGDDYQQYLNNLVARVNNLNNPSTNAPNFSRLRPTTGPALIQERFRRTRLGYLANCSVAATQLNPRFSCRGYLSGGLTDRADPVQEWRTFDSNLNEIIGQLQNSDLYNLHYLNCRMGSIRHIQQGAQQYAIVDYFCDGPLVGNYQFLRAEEQITADFHNTRLGYRAVCRQINPNRVDCELSLSSGLYNRLIDNATIEQSLEEDLAELKNQIYATRPSYYRDCDCTFSGESKRVNYGQRQKYLIRPVKCQIELVTQ